MKLSESLRDDPALAAIAAFAESQKVDAKSKDWRTRLAKPSQQTFTPGKSYFWVLATNHGTIRVRLNSDAAPMHATSTIYLTLLGFYDGLSFHRVIPGFMAQGGCPLGTGTGGPGYKYDGEFAPSLKHDQRGLLSMANAGPGTDGSQFFLTFVPAPWLDGKHTVFGAVVDGEQTLRELEKRGSAGSGRPTEPLRIERATIEIT